ncbi:MAG: L,D-transpeptidase [Elusimicrobia bacterium]|nr:L,D-transpeptidase [Elusimicrobiota bacterium]
MPNLAYTALLILWAFAFVLQAGRLSRQASLLGKTQDVLESEARTLLHGSQQLTRTIEDLRSLTNEMEFLQDLPNLLPQDKNYVRTQKAILEDVQELRRNVGRRLQNSLHIIVDGKANKLYLKKGLQLLWEADCSVGRGGTLIDKTTGRRWQFVTPRGEFKVLGKREKPDWAKPDWAFVEAGEPIPPPDDPKRKVAGELGAYVLNLGDGYLIHGTRNEELLGRPVSHGCVRLGSENLKKLYETAPVGTKAYIIY